jgi:hypothetical protein
MRWGLIIAVALACSACGVLRQPEGMIAVWTTDWHRVATLDDKDRLDNWRTTFIAAIDAAKKAGHSAEVEREGILLEPDVALPAPALPNGTYRCRVIKIGARTPGDPDYASYSGFTCEVRPTHHVQRLDKVTGMQRYAGVAFAGDSVHQVFLGTLVLGDESRALQYGEDETRDIAGRIERIGPHRWRVIMPKPHFESQLDVMELVPIPSGAHR